MDLPVLNAGQGQAAKGGCASHSCGSTDDQLAHLPEHIRAKVHNHPCYSEQAHHYFARMHVAVAPACNIQCNYCNRKYDCSNESRPGVVSEVLTPEQAVKKVMAVAAAIPQMTVLGIAGPVYFTGALLLGGWYLGAALVAAWGRSLRAARRLFVISIAYLPAVLGLLALDKTLF